MDGYPLYALVMGSSDADRKVNAALAACRAALTAIRSLGGHQARLDAAHELSERLRAYSDEAAQLRNDEVIRIWETEDPRPSFGQLGKRAHISKARAEQIIKRYEAGKSRQEALVTESVQPETPAIDPHAPLRPSIAAAVVTSKHGVLVERRHDGRPLWTLPAGEIEPGESPADCAIRETKEECGLQIVISHIIGERTHPKTGRHMFYLAARPYQSTAVHNGDEAELAEVRWASLDEANELLAGLFGPVAEHLKRTLGDR